MEPGWEPRRACVLTSAALPQHATDIWTYRSLVNAGKITLLLWYVWSTVSIMKSLVANRSWLRRRQGGIGGEGGMEHKFLESPREGCGWVLGRWGAGLSLYSLHSFAAQLRNSPLRLASGLSPSRVQPPEWRSSPPLAMVLQGAKRLCILTAPGREGFPVASALSTAVKCGLGGMCCQHSIPEKLCDGRQAFKTGQEERGGKKWPIKTQHQLPGFGEMWG